MESNENQAKKNINIEKSNGFDFKNIFSKIVKSYYIIIPVLCFLFWVFISMWKDGFVLFGVDFKVFYFGGEKILEYPPLIYTAEEEIGLRFSWLPVFAIMMIPYALFSFEIAEVLWFITLNIAGIANIILLNKILDLKQIIHRFSKMVFLLVMSNGWIYMATIDVLQYKLIVVTLIMLFLYKEIKIRQDGTEKTNKFYFIQCLILVLVVSMYPVLVFLPFFYLLQDVSIKEILSKSQIKKYLLFAGAFLAENFLMLFYPSMISYFINGFSHYGDTSNIFINLEYPFDAGWHLPLDSLENIFTALNIWIEPEIVKWISAVPVIGLSVLIALNKKWRIEEKFGYFAIVSLFLFIWPGPNSTVIYLYLIVILFMKKEFQLNIKAIWQDKIQLLQIIGLLAIVFISFYPPIYYIFEVLPFLLNLPLQIFILAESAAFTVIAVDLYLIYRVQKQ